MTLFLTLLLQGTLGAAAALIAIRLFRRRAPSLRLGIALAGLLTFFIPIPFKRDAMASSVASLPAPLLFWIALAGIGSRFCWALLAFGLAHAAMNGTRMPPS